MVVKSFSGRERCKLIDFGLSADTKRAELQGKSFIETDGIRGTYAFIAPELWDDELRTKSDIYSLAVTFFEIVTRQQALHAKWVNPDGNIPKAKSGIKFWMKVADNDHRPDFQNYTLPAEWITLISKCWAKDYNERPDAKQVIKALSSISVPQDDDNRPVTIYRVVRPDEEIELSRGQGIKCKNRSANVTAGAHVNCTKANTQFISFSASKEWILWWYCSHMCAKRQGDPLIIEVDARKCSAEKVVDVSTETLASVLLGDIPAFKRAQATSAMEVLVKYEVPQTAITNAYRITLSAYGKQMVQKSSHHAMHQNSKGLVLKNFLPWSTDTRKFRFGANKQVWDQSVIDRIFTESIDNRILTDLRQPAAKAAGVGGNRPAKRPKAAQGAAPEQGRPQPGKRHSEPATEARLTKKPKVAANAPPPAPTTAARVAAIKGGLTAKNGAKEVLRLLKELDTMTITLEILKSTKIGGRVKKLTTGEISPLGEGAGEILILSEKLVLTWKATAEKSVAIIPPNLD